MERERRTKNFSEGKLSRKETSVDDRISILWPKSGPRTKERKLIGRRAEIRGTKEGDVGRIML